MTMRVLTIHEPYASLIAQGIKKYETRHCQTKYRGKIAIHAAKKTPITLGQMQKLYAEIREQGADPSSNIKFPFGKIVAIADLVNIYLIEPQLPVSPLERLVGNWDYGRYAWHLQNIEVLRIPVPMRGMQGLQMLPKEIDLCP